LNRHGEQMKSQRYPAAPTADFAQFIAIVRKLRKECPWDRKQTHRSLRDGLIEESYEVVEVLDQNDLKGLRGELGDLLLHIALQATIAEQKGEFTFRQVLREINAKLIRRHPHVFGTRAVRSASDVKRNWDALKWEEGRTSVLEGVPKHLPALQRAQKVQERAARVGFDWRKRAHVWEKVREEMEELRRELGPGKARRRQEEFGDFLFALVNYARFVGVNPEEALRGTIEKFTRRFERIERELERRGRSPHESSLEEMDEIWNAVKHRKRFAKRKRTKK
jgi:tetrapyrrole methylase family protein / MazG family protein